MAQHELDPPIDRPARSQPSQNRTMRAMVTGGALLLALGAVLAACGDDDDASDTVTSETDVTESSAPASTEPDTTLFGGTTTRPPTTAGDSLPESSTPASTTEPASTGSDTASAGNLAAATSAPSSTAEGTESTEPNGSEPDGSGPPASIGPTTTGAECTFTQNDRFPIERCDAGPAVAAIQSVLQAREYGIGTVDCLFGDQTLYAVRAFQSDEELTVDGVVGSDTWAALDVLDDWGTDANGNGSIEPNEITLTCG